ncbi:hypothetical protein [Mucilaginibacter sp. SP1R1]|uniref:hypothetical protein n=1 Tax=Mucilaginibacter sp. SP1R1 TaxID=2723091 RepID=UPI00160C37E5|nr:hypothetical protein [Mucilaginibacter sp. SP1R1]MBB6152522.1 hypothetical protein [Mucilaginibacter sp. SP1R1]
MQYINLKAIKPVFFMVIACIFCSGAYAQTQPAQPSAAAVIGVTTYIDKFFKTYEKDGTSRAIINIFKTNPLVDSTSLKGLIAKIDTTRSLIGLYIGKELIVQRKASNSLVLYSYLVKHQKQPVRFTFMFYKPKNDWLIYRLYFDDQVDNELEESAKISGKQQ